VNLTNHSYWNLTGGGDILAHELRLHAPRFTEVDAELIPTGRLPTVAGTPLDFRDPKAVGCDIAGLEAGYDHNVVLADGARAAAAKAAELSDPSSGRRMRMSTTEPGVQLFTANAMDGVVGKRGAVYGRHAGLCLEAQHFPDAVNQPGFPSVVLGPGETYRQVTVYAFSAG
jgi:aldose 1-epimerase